MGASSNFGNMFSMAEASLFLPFLPMLSGHCNILMVFGSSPFPTTTLVPPL